MVDVYNAFIMRDKHFEQNCKSPDLKKKLITKSITTLNLPDKNYSTNFY